MLQNKHKVAILLSTYNGERYLPELFDSLMAQSYEDFTVYVRDDGSTDSTRMLISKYQEQDSRIVYIDDNLHFGPTQTFLHLLSKVDSNYYMLCDQDDVWLEEKIAITLREMQTLEGMYPEKPILVYTDVTVTDGDLNVVAPSMWAYSHMNVDLPTSFNYICVYNNISGCTSMLNKKARDSVRLDGIVLPRKIYHDWWIAICISKVGGIIEPIKQSTMLFRRHGDNETNVGTSNPSIIAKIGRFKGSIKNIYQRYSFFKNLGYGSFLKYLYYKTIVSLKTR